MTARPRLPPSSWARVLARRGQGNSAARRPLPLASPPRPANVVYGFGRIDASGRVAEQRSPSPRWAGGAVTG